MFGLTHLVVGFRSCVWIQKHSEQMQKPLNWLLSNQGCNFYYHGYMAQYPHVIYVLSITLSLAYAEKYSSLCLGVRNSKISLYMLNIQMLYMSHVMEKHVRVVVLHDNSLTSDPSAHRRSRIGVCLLFVQIMSIMCAIIVAWVSRCPVTWFTYAHCSRWLPRTINRVCARPGPYFSVW